MASFAGTYANVQQQTNSSVREKIRVSRDLNRVHEPDHVAELHAVSPGR